MKKLSRREWMSTVAAGSSLGRLAGGQERKPNVVFLIVDDLNDWVGCLGGHPQAKTPNIDRLARRGVLFANAHCQAPICNPSRASFLTGRLPSTTGVYQLAPNFRDVESLKDLVTLPEHFAAQGYRTHGVGKVFHHQDPKAFAEQGPRPGQGPLPKEKINGDPGGRLWDWGPIYTDEEMGDYKVASWAVERIEQADPDAPFFLACGFYRPHVPMYAPRRWFDLFRLETVELPPIQEGDRDDLPEFAKELTDGRPAPRHEWFLKNKKWRQAVQSYLASVSFVDSQVGRVLDALESSPRRGNTIVVLLGDHGWHLGEKERWAKRSLWERATKTPLVISVPGGPTNAVCERPVGLIDLYPTLIELCGLKARPGLEGQSLKTLLANPDGVRERPALTTFGKNNHALRSENFRYIRYADGSEELYDHRNDPHEWRNLAGDPKWKGVIRQSRKWLPRTNAEPVPGTRDPAAERWKAAQA